MYPIKLRRALLWLFCITILFIHSSLPSCLHKYSPILARFPNIFQAPTPIRAVATQFVAARTVAVERLTRARACLPAPPHCSTNHRLLCCNTNHSNCCTCFYYTLLFLSCRQQLWNTSYAWTVERQVVSFCAIFLVLVLFFLFLVFNFRLQRSYYFALL